MVKLLLPFALLMYLVALAPLAYTATFYVNPGESIQDAIDSSTHGDTVIVQPGIYYENIFFNGKNIVLTSTDPDSPAVVEATIIDGSTPDNPDYGSVVTFDPWVTAACVLTGFTIQNGSGFRSRDSYYYGGGVLGDDCYATIQNNTITKNSATWGGGLHGCWGLIQNNTITRNSAVRGGGLNGCGGVIQSNTITGNSATSGGGLSDCDGTIQSNSIAENFAEYGGGGLYWCDGTIQNNSITENSAKFGGGLYDSDGTIENNTIKDNSAEHGGGLHGCDGMIKNNTITTNSVEGSWASSGGGLYGCNGTIQNNSIIGNSGEIGGGLRYCDGTIQNNSITGNSATWGVRGCADFVIPENQGFGLADREGVLIMVNS